MLALTFYQVVTAYGISARFDIQQQTHLVNQQDYSGVHHFCACVQPMTWSDILDSRCERLQQASKS